MRKHLNRVTGAWKRNSRQRRRVNVSYDPNMVTALQQDTWMSKERFKKTSIKEKKKQITWRRRRRLGMTVARITLAASRLNKIGKMQSAGCRLCRRAREAQSESTDSLSVETYSPINSAGCEGMARQLRLPNTPSSGTCMTACMLHKSQKASSSLSHLTKKVSRACCRPVATRKLS